MDKWNWVHGRLSAIASQNPEQANKIRDFIFNNFESSDKVMVESTYLECLSVVRQQNDLWLEIGLQHARLSAYIAYPENFRVPTADAVALVGRLHEEEALGCPLLTCFIDLFGTLWSYLDPEGTAQERLVLFEEQLTKVSPTSICYFCMTMDQVFALGNLGRWDDAVQAYREAVQKSPAVKNAARSRHFKTQSVSYVAKPLVWGSDPAAGVALLEGKQGGTPMDQHLMHCIRFVGLVRAGQMTNAQKEWPLVWDAQRPLSTTNHTHLLDAVPLAMSHDFPIDISEGAQVMTEISQNTYAFGRVRDSFRAAALAFKFASELEDREAISRALQLMQQSFAELHTPAGADVTLADAQRRW